MLSRSESPKTAFGNIVYDSYDLSLVPTVRTCDVYNLANEKLDTFDIVFDHPFKHRYDHRISMQIHYSLDTIHTQFPEYGNIWLTINCGYAVGHLLFYDHQGLFYWYLKTLPGLFIFENLKDWEERGLVGSLTVSSDWDILHKL